MWLTKLLPVFVSPNFWDWLTYWFIDTWPLESFNRRSIDYMTTEDDQCAIVLTNLWRKSETTVQLAKFEVEFRSDTPTAGSG